MYWHESSSEQSLYLYIVYLRHGQGECIWSCAMKLQVTRDFFLFYTHSWQTCEVFCEKRIPCTIKHDLKRFTGICALAEDCKCFYNYWYCEHIPIIMNDDESECPLYFYNSQDVPACVSSSWMYFLLCIVCCYSQARGYRRSHHTTALCTAPCCHWNYYNLLWITSLHYNKHQSHDLVLGVSNPSLH